MNMRWIALFMAAAMLVGCAGLEAEKQAKRTATALAEMKEAMSDCEEQRRQGKVIGYLGVHRCANDRVVSAWVNSGDRDSDLFLRIWDYQGKLKAVLDAGEISYAAYELMGAQFGAQIRSESEARSAREAQLKATRATNMLMLWQGLQPTSRSGGGRASPTYCTSYVPPPNNSGQTAIITTNCY